MLAQSRTSVCYALFRTIQTLVNPILAALSPRFQTMYSAMGRPSLPPARLLRALLVQILFTIRSERQLKEQLNYNLLLRWFVGLNPEELSTPTRHLRTD
jgi:transposase